MANDFYEFSHECDEMPEEMKCICKVKGSRLTQATIEKYISHVGLFQTTMYGWSYCPYCGKNLGDING